MATSEGPNSPGRIERQSGFVKPPGFDAMDLSEQLYALGVAYKRVEGESQYESNMRMRVARNNAIMERMGVTSAAQDFRKAHLQPKLKEARKPPVRRNLVPLSDIHPRRSERNDGKKRNYVEVGERYRWEEKKLRAKLPRLNREGRPRMVQVRQIFATQSDYAIGKAIDAAVAKAAEAEDGRAFAKRMEPSNVAGGFWQQLPAVMARAWPFQQKACIEIECEDASRKHSAIKRERGLSTWEFQKGENERRWPMIWLPRGGSSAGLSGGWRGFALDQELTPNDSVVWEVPADVPFGKLPTYIKVHLFRAESYETEESSRYVVTIDEEREKQLRSCETVLEAEEEAGVESGEEGAEAGKAGGEACPVEAAAGEVEPSQAPAAVQKGRKASSAVRVSKADTAAPIKEGGNDSKAGTLVGSKGAKKGKKAEEAVTAMEARKGKKATAGSNGIAKEAAAAQAAPAAGRPWTSSRRARKPSAVLVDLVQRRWEEEQERLNRLAAEGVASEENFDVEVILKVKDLQTADPRFKVRWVGYTAEYDTWEPYSMFEGDVFQYAWANEAIRAKARKQAKRWKK